LSLVNVKTSLLHLNTEFSHHDSWLSFILVGLNHSFVFVWMVVCALISLCESVVISLACPIISESTEVRLLLVLLVNFNSDNLDLVVSQTDFDWEFLGHHELVSFNRVEVMLGLLLHLSLILPILKHVLSWLLLLHHLLLIVPTHHLIRLYKILS
jgi:hypothetical protein